eukprot:scaffold496945_cov14-Prasinocladus_malaysianus.AAC.1
MMIGGDDFSGRKLTGGERRLVHRETAGPEVVPDSVNHAMLGKLTEQIGDLQVLPPLMYPICEHHSSWNY